MFYTSNTFVPYNYPLKEAEVVFLGIPFVSGSLSKPALYGPLVVRESLKLVEGLPEKKICDVGDLEVVPGSYKLTAERIKQTIEDIKNENQNAFLLFIGGEHSITLPITEALKPKTIIQLDAHADLRQEYLGNKFMQQTWAFHASRFAKIIQIGVVAMNKEEEKERESTIQMSPENFISNTPALEKPVHLTIDIDVLKNVATGLPEGKLEVEEVLSILNKIKPDSLDIVEIADFKLPSVTGFIAAKLIKKVLEML